MTLDEDYSSKNTLKHNIILNKQAEAMLQLS